MKNWRKTLALALAVVLMASVLVMPAAMAEDGKMFNIVLTAAFTGFDPLRTNDSAST